MLRVSRECQNEKKLGKIGAGEGIRILDPLNLYFMRYQNLKNLIVT